jgi:hypothetical protein
LTLEEFESARYLRIKRVRSLQQQGDLDDNLRWKKGRFPDMTSGAIAFSLAVKSV